VADLPQRGEGGHRAENKGGYGFHPLLVFADATGELLSGMLRPGNAGANDIAHHVVVLDEAIPQLPEAAAAGHREGDDPCLVRRDIGVRADFAGCTTGFSTVCRARNVGFAVVAGGRPEANLIRNLPAGRLPPWAPQMPALRCLDIADSLRP